MGLFEQKVMPLIPLNTIDCPVAFFVAADDMLCPPTDARWTADQIGVEFYQTYPGDHDRFTAGTSLDYWSDYRDFMALYQGQSLVDPDLKGNKGSGRFGKGKKR